MSPGDIEPVKENNISIKKVKGTFLPSELNILYKSLKMWKKLESQNCSEDSFGDGPLEG